MADSVRKTSPLYVEREENSSDVSMSSLKVVGILTLFGFGLGGNTFTSSPRVAQLASESDVEDDGISSNGIEGVGVGMENEDEEGTNKGKVSVGAGAAGAML